MRWPDIKRSFWSCQLNQFVLKVPLQNVTAISFAPRDIQRKLVDPPWAPCVLCVRSLLPPKTMDATKTSGTTFVMNRRIRNKTVGKCLIRTFWLPDLCLTTSNQQKAEDKSNSRLRLSSCLLNNLWSVDNSDLIMQNVWKHREKLCRHRRCHEPFSAKLKFSPKKKWSEWKLEITPGSSSARLFI